MRVLDEIKSRIDIVDLVSNYVALKKAGRNYKGLCPFHAEKTPSFVVFPDTQSWHCFGACGVGGDAFSFLMKHEGYEFQEALQALANRTGVPLSERSPAAAAADQHLQKLQEMVAAAADYFHQLLLKSPDAAYAREYIAERSLTADTVQKFQLGFARNQWEGLKNHLLQRGYLEADLLSAGLLVKPEEGSSGYDRFRDRLLFPIRNERGQVVGFGARALQPNQVPKYLNSPQSPLFDKSAVLYGLDLARKSIRDAGRAVIVEGYMDVLQTHQAGQTNVVAQMGTALTEQQLRLLKRFTKQFVLALDSDTAGDAATLRGINVARAALDREVVARPTARGLIRYEERLDADIRIAGLPPGKDPDDLVKDSIEAWQTVIDGAQPIVDFYIDLVNRKMDLTSARGKSTAVRELVPILREISDPVEREGYVQKLARLVRIDERTLMAEVETRPAGRGQSRPPRGLAAKPGIAAPDFLEPASEHMTAGMEEHCLATLIGAPSLLSESNARLLEQKVAPLMADDFQDPENRQIFLAIQQWVAQESPTIETLSEQVNESLAEKVVSLVALWQQGPIYKALIANADEKTLTALAAFWHSWPSPDTERLARKLLVNFVLSLRIHRLSEQLEKLRFLQEDETAAQDYQTTRHYLRLIEQNSMQLKILEQARDALSIMGQRRFESTRMR
jgi:DNA primase